MEWYRFYSRIYIYVYHYISVWINYVLKNASEFRSVTCSIGSILDRNKKPNNFIFSPPGFYLYLFCYFLENQQFNRIQGQFILLLKPYAAHVRSFDGLQSVITVKINWMVQIISFSAGIKSKQ